MCAVVLLWASQLQSQGPEEVDCQRVLLTPGLSWPTSAVWFTGSEGRPTLLVVDAARATHRLVTVTPEGRVATAAGNGLEEAHFPIVVRAQGQSIFIDSKTPDPKLLRFDHRFAFQGVFRSLEAVELEDGGTLLDLYNWVPWEEGVLGMGLARHGEEDYLALTYLPPEGRGQVFERFPYEELGRQRDHFVHNLDYLAPLTGAGFFLDLTAGPSLRRVDPDATLAPALARFPGTAWRQAIESDGEWAREWDHRQQPGGGRRRAFAYYEMLEQTPAITGLIAGGEEGVGRGLHALSKGAYADGKTPWWLLELEPATGQELRRLRLPSDAAHLAVVPPNPEVLGSSWALIERRGVGRRSDGAPIFTSPSIVFVPPALIAAPPRSWIDDGEEAPRCTESLQL